MGLTIVPHFFMEILSRTFFFVSIKSLFWENCCN